MERTAVIVAIYVLALLCALAMLVIRDDGLIAALAAAALVLLIGLIGAVCRL